MMIIVENIVVAYTDKQNNVFYYVQDVNHGQSDEVIIGKTTRSLTQPDSGFISAITAWKLTCKNKKETYKLLRRAKYNYEA